MVIYVAIWSIILVSFIVWTRGMDCIHPLWISGTLFSMLALMCFLAVVLKLR